MTNAILGDFDVLLNHSQFINHKLAKLHNFRSPRHK